MKKHLCLVTTVFYCVGFGIAMGDDLSAQIQLTRSACSGISDSMSDLKKMAGINTAVTSVGSIAGGVALGTGIAKKKVDEDYELLKSKIAKLISSDTNPETHILADESNFYKQIDDFIENATTDTSTLKTDSEKLKELEQNSKTLGNIRTGTLAGTAVMDAAGTIIAANNKVNDDLQSRINNCVTEVKKLQNIKTQSQLENTSDSATINKANTIIHECGDWEYADLSSINKKAKGAAISSGTGAALAIVGTITSASANSDSVRQNENKDKEKNLNTTSNVLAGGATGTSVIATIFNATQISAIKKVVKIADKCEEALK